MWCVLEINLSIIGGSIPAAKPFIQRIFPRLLGSYGGGSTQNNIYLYSARAPASHSQAAPGITSNYMGTITSAARYEDTGSEENIMVEKRQDPSFDGTEGQITKTVAFSYKVEEGLADGSTRV